MTDATHQITYHILSYLVDNPDAQDTLKGISEWWLPEPEDAAAVQEVVAGLVESGLIMERRSAQSGAEPYYKVNRDRLGEVKAWLARFEGPDPPAN